MDLVFLHGPPAVGKLTVARALAARTGLKLFHNHLVLDAITAVFDYATPPYVRLREAIWLQMFEAAAAEGVSLVFTFMPEISVQPAFPERVRAAIRPHGGRLRLVELTCPVEALDDRLDAPSRADFAKLRDVAMMRDLRATGWLDYPMPPSELTLDTAALSPDAAAAAIQTGLNLPDA